MSSKPGGAMTGFDEFGERPFAAGTLVGLRGWYLRNGDAGSTSLWSTLRMGPVSEDCTLRSLHFPHEWRDGENVSVCKPIADRVRYYNLDGDLLREEPMLPCSGVAKDCSCGFWAYTDEHVSIQGDTQGVIEGYGKCSIGPLGFRAEKARVVALVVPSWDRAGYLARRYPSAKLYPAVGEMLDAHPLSAERRAPRVS